MKTKQEIIKQHPVYLNNFKSKIEVISEFEGTGMTEKEYYAEKAPYANEKYWHERKTNLKEHLENKYKTVNILFASYGCENYSGDAWVLFEQNGNLYEINAGHCSCYGLENQWEPEEVILEELHNRLQKGTFGEDSYSGNEFKKKN